MNQLIADRISQNLGNLTHPGDDKTPPTPIPLPMFRASALTDEQRKHFADEAGLPTMDIGKLVAEAVVALIEADHDIIPKAQTAAMRTAAAAAESHRNKRINLRCRCGTELITAEVNDFDTAHPTFNAGPVIRYMQSISPECALGHKAI